MTLPIQGYTAKQLLTPYPNGVLMQGFDEPSTRIFYNRSFGMTGHNGCDWATGYGHSILAVWGGKVLEAVERNTGYGMHVRIISEVGDKIYDHIYGHLSKTIVKVGDIVKEGQKIGEEGNSGTTMSGAQIFWGGADPTRSGTHLHWGVRELLKGAHDGFQISYSTGELWTIKDYSNGFLGYIDPLPMLTEATNLTKNMFRLIKKSAEAKEIFAVIDNKRYWVSDPITFEQGRKILWTGWEEIEITDIMQYEYAGAIILFAPDDPNK